MIKRVLLILTLVFGLTSMDMLYAKGGKSGGGFKSRSSSSKSFSSKKKTTPKRTTYPSKSTSSKSTPSKSTTSSKKSGGGFNSSKSSKTTTKPLSASQKKSNADYKKMQSAKKSPSYKKADAALTKSIGKSGKTYSSASAAKKDMTAKMASKKYDYKDSKTAMSQRPDFVPQNHTGPGGTVYVTSYHGGHYGYHDAAGLFIMYSALHYQSSVRQDHLYAYGYTPTHHRPQVVHHDSGGGFWKGFLIFLVILGVVVFLIWLFNRPTKTVTTVKSGRSEGDW